MGWSDDVSLQPCLVQADSAYNLVACENLTHDHMPRATTVIELVLLAHGVVMLVAGLIWYAFRGERVNPHPRGRAGGRHPH